MCAFENGECFSASNSLPDLPLLVTCKNVPLLFRYWEQIGTVPVCDWSVRKIPNSNFWESLRASYQTMIHIQWRICKNSSMSCQTGHTDWKKQLSPCTLCFQGLKDVMIICVPRTFMIVHVSPIFPELCEFSSTVLANSFQILFCSSFFTMCGFLYMSSVQSFLIKFFSTYITPKVC